jgi:hypothetical protein
MGVALISKSQLCNAAGNKFTSASVLEAKLNELPFLKENRYESRYIKIRRNKLSDGHDLY